MKEIARVKNIEVYSVTNLLEIDIINKKGSFAVVVCDGKVTHQGKV